MQLKRITLFHKDTNASVSIVDYLYGPVVLLGCPVHLPTAPAGLHSPTKPRQMHPSETVVG